MISKPLNNLTLKRRIWINDHSQPLLIQLGANLFDLHTSHISCNFPGQAWYRDRPMGCNPSVELSISTFKVHQRHCQYLKNSTTSTSVSVKVHQNFCQKGHVIPTRLDAVHQSSSWVESWSGGEVRRVKKTFGIWKLKWILKNWELFTQIQKVQNTNETYLLHFWFFGAVFAYMDLL